MPEDKISPKIRKCWMHRSFEALKAVDSGRGDTMDVEGTFFDRYHVNLCNNVDSCRRTATKTTFHPKDASSANASLVGSYNDRPLTSGPRALCT